MKSFRIRAVIVASVLGLSLTASAQPPRGTPKTRDQVIDAAIAYLKSTQAEDGSWSKASHPGITAVVLTGLFQTGKITADDPMAVKALKFIEGLADAKEGHLAAGENIRHKFYMTNVNVQALKASGVTKYEPTIQKAIEYVKKGQVGATDGKVQEDINYGGFGYGPGARGDMSNTHFAMDAFVAAGVSKDDPAFKRTLVFVSRCQNLKSEFNTQPWADKINDGSFIYVLPQPGAKGNPDDPKPGYGSMTFAGIKCLALCGVSRDDPRFTKAMTWVAKNYSVDVNPGRAEGAGGQGYYYYLVAMAKCLKTLGVDKVETADGKPAREWRADITRALTNRQRPNGSWGNDFAMWMESDPNLDTGYALIALGLTAPPK